MMAKRTKVPCLMRTDQRGDRGDRDFSATARALEWNDTVGGMTGASDTGASGGQVGLRDALTPGTVLGDYELGRVLGYGGYSVVYRARHRELGYPVAVKEFLPADLAVRERTSVHPRGTECLPHYQDGMDRFKKEALQLMQFRDDPGVVTGLSFFRANGTAYFVMEYVDGMSLAELLRERESAGRPLDESELVSFVMPLLDTLSGLHRADVLHRDLKPSNILVRRSHGRPVLIDFGAAKQGAAVHSKSAAPFTEGYAALEQVSEGRLGPWTDLYAVGAVMWRVVAGSNPPWTPPNPKKVELRAAAALSGRPDPMPSATEVGKGRFSSRILQAVDSCLQLRPESRMRSCKALQHSMGRVTAAGEGVPNLSEQGRDSNGGQREIPSRVSKPAPRPRKPARSKEAARTKHRVSGAARWYRLAAGLGLARAQSNLGVLYKNGRGVAQDDAEATRWFRLAAQQGNAGAQHSLGVMYEKGRGVAQDDAEATRWYRLAAEQGLASAQSNLGWMYARGRGVAQDDAEAIRWYRLAAEQGLASAQSNLGWMYEKGRGVAQDDAEATRWYRLAAEQGLARAQHHLGWMYARGRGVAQDDAEATRWFRLAAEQGNAGAQHSLAAMYMVLYSGLFGKAFSGLNGRRGAEFSGLLASGWGRGRARKLLLQEGKGRGQEERRRSRPAPGPARTQLQAGLPRSTSNACPKAYRPTHPRRWICHIK